ncbi:hypothetical protein [Rubinisphaera sp.]|uniref:hypothetical protein n=1 Tax=Rubinisphaera sp. TaxID=2024857 RepID=UPI000C0C6FC1|nr:hypothetical protein [Rubinisphaera sp.]MBV07653.1 hypothetical protein [Rubinisphaera sp.]|tara:strand:+ start:3951 stop:5177 length:1227 start_codon:yes stop_codon:yes gene_type:complete
MKSYLSLLVIAFGIIYTISIPQMVNAQMSTETRISIDLHRYSASLWDQFSLNDEEQPIRVQIDSPTLENVRGLVEEYPMIEEIHLRYSEQKLPEDDFGEICIELAKLQHLKMFDNQFAIAIGDSACRSIGMLTQIEKLHVFLGDVSISGINHLAKLNNLKTLELRVPGLNDDTMAAAIIRRFPLLTEIYLSGLGIGPQTFDAVGSVKSLSILWLKHRIEVDGEAFAHLLKCHQLQELWLRCQVQEDWYDTIGRLNSLKLLDLGRVCADRDLSKLASLNQLEVLRIYGGTYSDRSLAKLNRLTQLKQLTLSSENVAGSAFRELSEFDQLKELRLKHTKFVPENGPYLAELESLEYLDLSWTPLAWSNDWESLVPLARLQHLRKIWIDFKDKPAHELRKRIPGVTIEYYE